MEKKPLLERLKSYAYLSDDHVAVEAAERIDELKRENAELRKVLTEVANKIRELERNASRYQWLVENAVGCSMHMGAVLYTPQLVIPRDMNREEIDKAIDVLKSLYALDKEIATIDADRTIYRRKF